MKGTLVTAVLAAGLTAAAAEGPQTVCLRGLVGARLDAMVANGLGRIDWQYLDFPFTQKTETGSWNVLQPGIWQTEFWGKFMQAAVPLAKYTGSETLKKRIGDSVRRLLATQQKDGYIGNYRPQERGTVCDVWGCKYVLMGLLHWYDLTHDKAALDGSAKLVDWLMSVSGPGKMSLGATGPFCGLMNCSVLEPVVWTYRRTGERKYLDYAKWIVSELDTNAEGPELISLALKGVPVSERHADKSGHKAYEMMSCCQGLLDYWQETGDRRCLDAVVKSAENILADEIDICGGGTKGERFEKTARMQTRDYALGSETCVLITWIRLCEKLLEATGEPRWADELERSFFNAYLGQLVRDGSAFAAYSTLGGIREQRHPLHCRMETNCCRANGPRGFVAFVESAATATDDAVTVNQYVFGRLDVPCAAAAGGVVTLDSFTEYPRGMRYALTLALKGPSTFALRFRAPKWSKKTTFETSSGEKRESSGGEYVKFRRTWQPGDQIAVTFDGTVAKHERDGFVAFTRGPLVLARDRRFGDGDLSECVFAKDFSFTEIQPVDEGLAMAFSSVLKMGAHDNPPRPVSFCDYASAGNTCDAKSFYRVWLPTVERW